MRYSLRPFRFINFVDSTLYPYNYYLSALLEALIRQSVSINLGWVTVDLGLLVNAIEQFAHMIFNHNDVIYHAMFKCAE